MTRSVALEGRVEVGPAVAGSARACRSRCCRARTTRRRGVPGARRRARARAQSTQAWSARTRCWGPRCPVVRCCGPTFQSSMAPSAAVGTSLAAPPVACRRRPPSSAKPGSPWPRRADELRRRRRARPSRRGCRPRRAAFCDAVPRRAGPRRREVVRAARLVDGHAVHDDARGATRRRSARAASPAISRRPLRAVATLGRSWNRFRVEERIALVRCARGPAPRSWCPAWTWRPRAGRARHHRSRSAAGPSNDVEAALASAHDRFQGARGHEPWRLPR